MKTAFALSLLLSYASACAPAPMRSSPPIGSSNRVLAGAELTHPSASNAFDLIRAKRPEFFRGGGAEGRDGPVLYVDDSIASVDQLRLIPTDVLLEIRCLTAPEAMFRFGPGHPAGAIVVTTKRRRTPDRQLNGVMHD